MTSAESESVPFVTKIHPAKAKVRQSERKKDAIDFKHKNRCNLFT